MRDDIEAVLQRSGGATSRSILARNGIARTALDHEVRTRGLIRVFPRGYVRPWDEGEPEQRERAAYFGIGWPVAFSHLTALRRWQLVEEAAEIHLTVPNNRCPRRQQGLVVHRASRFPPVVRVDGVIITQPAEAIVASWPLLAARERRAPAITAVRDKLVRPAELSEALRRHEKLRGRGELRVLIALLADGCESELELWGTIHVFDVPALRHGVRQLGVTARGRRYRLDLAYPDEKVDVEMDGDRYHSTRQQRERDRRRDAALASIGWLTLRFSYDRLHSDIDGCRAETLAALRLRSRTKPDR